MKPFILEKMSIYQRKAQRELEERISRIPDDFRFPGGENISCHVLAHSLSAFQFSRKLRPVDGWLVGDHGWLEDRDNNVYDIYPGLALAGSNAGVLFVSRRVRVHYETVAMRKWRFTERFALTGFFLDNPGRVKSPFNPLLRKNARQIRMLVDIMS